MGFKLVGSSGPLVGLDVGTDHMRIAQLKATGSGFALQRYGVVRLPMGAVVEGEIVDADAVANAVKQLMKSVGIRNGEAAIGVSNQKVVVRLVDLPYLPEAELRSALQYQAQDYIPIPVEEAIMDFEVIGDYMTANDEHMNEVLLVAAQRDMIDATCHAVEKSGLKLNAIDVTPFAVTRGIFGTNPENSLENLEEAGEATAVIHMSAGITNIVVVEKGTPRFTRVSSLAGNEMTQAIASAINISFEEAEELKVQIGLPGFAGQGQNFDGIDPQLIADVQMVLQREVAKFTAEVRRSLDYYLSQAAQVHTIRRILLTGSGANLANFAYYLERGMQIKVELADALKWITVPPQYRELMQADRLGATAALGLAMGNTSE